MKRRSFAIVYASKASKLTQYYICWSTISFQRLGRNHYEVLWCFQCQYWQTSRWCRSQLLIISNQQNSGKFHKTCKLKSLKTQNKNVENQAKRYHRYVRFLHIECGRKMYKQWGFLFCYILFRTSLSIGYYSLKLLLLF